VFGIHSGQISLQESGQIPLQFTVHAEEPPMQLWHGESRIHDAQYSPDQRYVVVASEDGTAHICYAAFADTLNLAQERALREMTDSERQTYLHTP
jgi:hypothetical protein